MLRHFLFVASLDCIQPIGLPSCSPSFCAFRVFSPFGLYGLSAWANSLWHLPITWVSLVQHFFLISPGIRAHEIDPVVWSLVTEMKVSLIFPAVLALVQKTKTPQLAILALACAFACDIFFHLFGLLLIFLLGSYIAKYRSRLVSILAASVWRRVGLALCGYVLYGTSWILPIPNPSVSMLASALGAAAWLLLFLSSNALHRIGTARPVEFLGNVSYSFYLIHLPILLAITSVLYPHIGAPLLCVAISLACSLFLAYLIYIVVEIPGQNWGKRATKAWNQRFSEFSFPSLKTE